VGLCEGFEVHAELDLNELTHLALRNAKRILLYPFPEEIADKEDVALIRIKASMSASVLTAQLRADEAVFRRKQIDLIPAILDRLQKQEKLLELTAVEHQ
jgi:hypothetical protein